MSESTGWVLLVWLGSCLGCYVIGRARGAPLLGLLLGLLCGPLGLLLILLIDRRPVCPVCHGRLIFAAAYQQGGPKCCPHCKARLRWRSARDPHSAAAVYFGNGPMIAEAEPTTDN